MGCILSSATVKLKSSSEGTKSYLFWSNLVNDVMNELMSCCDNLQVVLVLKARAEDDSQLP